MNREKSHDSPKKTAVVLDTSFFFYNMDIEGELYTTPEVIDECSDPASSARIVVYRERGLRVREPEKDSVDNVLKVSEKTGDVGKLSKTDIGLLALALENDARICSDDFAIRNVALALGISIEPMMQRRIRYIEWKFRCKGCARYYDKAMVCPVCGADVTRKLK